jgi:hypothetical protein
MKVNVCERCHATEIYCSECSKRIDDNEFLCIDTTGGADDPEHFHKECFNISGFISKIIEVNEHEVD